jgi:hypothetical protein
MACASTQKSQHDVPQPKLHWSAYLWPGLPQLWLRGSWVGLTLAVGFTALVNVLLTATLVWNEWLPPRAKATGLGSLAIIWIVAWVDARADWRRIIAEWSTGEQGTADPEARSDQWFQAAQVAYLGGDWVSAEQTLIKLLRHEPRDAESRLLLATLWRHEGHFEKASAELDRLERLETATPWQYEIARERERICATRVEPKSQEACKRSAPANGSPSPEPAVSGAIAAKMAVPTHGTQIAAQDAATNRRMAA